MMQIMAAVRKDVVIFNPTPNEYEAVKRHVASAEFKNIRVTVVESGMGKINAAFAMAAEVLPRLAAGNAPALLIGAGTSGSLSQTLASGDIIVSNSSTVGDWRMEDDAARHLAPYGDINFRPLDPALAEEMAITCNDPAVTGLMARLDAGFKRGRMLTTDTFVSGAAHKLRLGRDFAALACDMESAAFAYTAASRLGGLPWLTIRIVADTSDDSLNDYVHRESNMVEILGQKTRMLLKTFDDMLA
jgi:nucleoside phosphorylase